jgi:hypothetical protein
MITLNLTEQQFRLIMAALVELPYKVSAQLLAELNKQASQPKEDADDGVG